MPAKVISDTDLAARRLLAGGLVAIPTETVYGLAADALSAEAVAKIYRAKNRPNDHPVIVHISDPKLVSFWAASVPPFAQKLMSQFWPGPMTLILPRGDRAKDFITGGQDTVGIRIPNHPVALDVLRRFEGLGGKGVAAPSANRFGAVSPTSSTAVEQGIGEYLGSDDLILEGGRSSIGVESTIVDCTGEKPKILRPGAITAEQIASVTGLNAESPEQTDIRVSGSHKLHYSPNAKVLLNVEPAQGDGLIALKSVATPEGVIRLAAPGDLEGYARELYASLRKADELGLRQICVIEPDGSGLAIAIRDRVRRAAAKG